MGPTSLINFRTALATNYGLLADLIWLVPPSQDEAVRQNIYLFVRFKLPPGVDRQSLSTVFMHDVPGLLPSAVADLLDNPWPPYPMDAARVLTDQSLNLP